MNKKGRQPSDYPQFAFRLSATAKEKLTEMINEVTDYCNKDLGPGEYMFRKNEIIIEALERGLKDIKKKPMKKN
ncbi:MAG: hypothetical protein H6622_13475 [Halobacteriovoraceae bacterium]|nr:hypothetical protein [Halobacteriovoraceae bacterium]